LIPTWVDRTEYPFEPRALDADGGRLSYVDEGEGAPIVMVHGTPTWSFLYRHLIKGLAPRYRCVAPDHLGFGLSERPAAWSYRPEDQAKNLARLKPDCSRGIAKLHAIELHASLFDQPRGLAARFLQVERLPINVRNERDGFKFLQRGRGKQRQVGMFQIALAKTRVPFIERFLGESSRMVGLHDFAGELLFRVERMRTGCRQTAK